MSGSIKKILFLSPPFVLHQDFIDYPYFANLGMLQNAAVCREKGLNVVVFDAFAQPWRKLFRLDGEHYWMGCRAERLHRFLDDMKPEVTVLCGHPFLNLQSRNGYLETVLERIAASNPRGAIVLADCYIGGMHYVDVPPETIRANYPAIRHIVKYHGEVQLPALLERILDNPAEAPLTVYGRQEEVEMDSLPAPAWDGISLEDYISFSDGFFEAAGRRRLFRAGGRALPAVVSRGCIFRCSFCTSNPGGDRAEYIRMSESSMNRLFLAYRDNWGCRRIVFLDGLANPSSRDLDLLLDLLDGLGLDYDFPNGFRADRLTRRQLVRMKGHVTMLSVSAESGVDDVVENIVGKRQAVESVERVAAWCGELDIPLIIHYLAGLPGETVEDALGTFSHALEMKEKYNARPSVQFATPVPGTRLYRQAAAENFLVRKSVPEYSPCFSKGGLIDTPELPAATLREIYGNWLARLDAEKVRKVVINLTYACNNNCFFCAVGDRKKRHGDFSDVLDGIYRYYALGARTIDFDGGEPTMYPRLTQAVSAARRTGYSRVTVTTNGRRLSDLEFCRKLLASGITDLLVTLLGVTRETHEKHTRAPGSYGETVEGIKNVLASAPPDLAFALNATLTALNYRELPDLVAAAAGWGVKVLNVQLLTPFGSAEKDHAPPPEDAARMIVKAIEVAGENLKMQVINLPPCFLPGYEKYAAGDFLKRSRHMIFVGEKGENLAGYLSRKRIKTEKCGRCPHSLVCDGFYVF